MLDPRLDEDERTREREAKAARERHGELVDKHVYGEPERRPQGRADWYRHMSASSLGLEMGVAIALCTFGARWLENNVTHWKWTTLIGLLVGCGAAANAVIRTIREVEREDEAREAQEAQEAASAEREDADILKDVGDGERDGDE